MDTKQTLELLKAALASGAPDDLAKAWVQSGSATTGLTYYDLEAPAKTLYPVLTPLRNIIPRVNGKGGIQANWKAVTGINTANLSGGLQEGARGGVISTTVADYYAAYRGIGLDDTVTFEAEYAANGFEDIKARATRGLLEAVMLQEEKIILGGNGTAVALGTTPTPTVTDVATGGTLSANTAYSVICVALTMDGYSRASLAGGVVATYSRTNGDGSITTVSGGAAQKSSPGTVTTANDANSTHALRASVTPVRGAVAYAWYAGASGTERLAAITTINSVLITSVSGTSQLASALPAEDHSKDTLVFDGLLYQALKSGSGAYYKAMPTGTAGAGTPLTADTQGGIVEFDEAFQSLWDNYRLSPTAIWVNSQELKNITAKILTGGQSAAQRFTFQVTQQGVVGGMSPKGYLNRFAMGGAVEVPINLHPNMPPGTILMTADRIPYPLSGVQDVYRMLLRKEYYQMEWPLRTRKYEYGVYFDGVLQHYFPPSMAVITNIANG
jgi:hypothetical protein